MKIAECGPRELTLDEMTLVAGGVVPCPCSATAPHQGLSGLGQAIAGAVIRAVLTAALL